MARDAVPAIVRPHTDRSVEVVSMPYDGVSFRRGFGDVGYRVEVVKHECPVCTFDRMIRRVDMAHPPEERYWCLNPNCVHYVSDSLSYSCHGSPPQRNASEPEVVEER